MIRITDLTPRVNGYVAPADEITFIVAIDAGVLADYRLSVVSSSEKIWDAGAYDTGYSGTIDDLGLDANTGASLYRFTFTCDDGWPAEGSMSFVFEQIPE